MRRVRPAVQFRAQLVRTLEAVEPVLKVPGVLLVGSEVPNLLERGAAATLVVSKDVDLAVPVRQHGVVKEALRHVQLLVPSSDEPSVWLPSVPDLLEVNFLGMDPSIHDASETYVLEDAELPLLVFGQLSLMRAGDPVQFGKVVVPVPRRAGLMAEKLLTDRSGIKGDRDLLVVAGLLESAEDTDLDELVQIYADLPPELRLVLRSSLTTLSLMKPVTGMPDPQRHRARIADLTKRLEREGWGL